MVEVVVSEFEPHLWSEGMTPFEVLISTVLSQKTERRGTRRAFLHLKKGLGINPTALARADEDAIAELIKPAGLYRSKAPKIKAIALSVLELYGGDLTAVLELPEQEARVRLMALPGVGPKTADVVLSFVARKAVLPVDVHIFRIAERWHAVGKEARYEEVRAALESAVPPEMRLAAHLALIEFGREICVARKPKCSICMVNAVCPSAFTF
ncbi:MAG: endonuclease III [Actinobacteria bacterium]|nr:endonuclease III [Actinomycetota bacterium]